MRISRSVKKVLAVGCAGAIAFSIAFVEVMEDAKADNQVCPALDVCFSPNGDCDKKIFTILDHYMATSPKIPIRFNAYFLTNHDFAARFEQFADLGANVEGLIDHECDTGRFASACKNADMPNVKVKMITVPHGIDHDKYIIVGNDLVITGSANLTRQAFKNNYENIIFIWDKPVINKYINDFESIYQVTP